MATLGERLQILKDSQKERLEEMRSLFVEPWDCEIKIKKLKLNDIILAENASIETLENGVQRTSDEIKKAVIVLLGVDGLHPLRDKDFILGEPAGVIASIFKEILDFSGFGTSVEAVTAEKKSA